MDTGSLTSKSEKATDSGTNCDNSPHSQNLFQFLHSEVHVTNRSLGYLSSPPSLPRSRPSITRVSADELRTLPARLSKAPKSASARSTRISFPRDKTDHEGDFCFPYLSVGDYEVSVKHAGFQDITRPVTLTVGADFEVPFSLVIGQTGTKVEVSRRSAASGDRAHPNRQHDFTA